MWYEIIPTVTIITAALTVPFVYAYYSNKLVLGQPFKRVIIDGNNSFFFLRDCRLNNGEDGYTYNGLERIPDEKSA